MTDNSPDESGALFPEIDNAPIPSPQAPLDVAREEATAKSAPYRVLARKYRPKNFEELIGQDVMVRILTNAFALGRVHQAYMLTGVRGVGKTTTARILARALNYALPAKDGRSAIDRPTVAMPELGVHCQAIIESRHVDVFEMDAASHTSVDDIREIIEGARYKPAAARMKIYIIDEVHMLSKSAFNALLKTLEEPPEHVKFVFATTEIDRVPVTVRSRCLRFDLRRVEPGEMTGHLARICDAENVKIEEEALAMIARASEGSVRDSLSLLDQAIAHGGGRDLILASEVRGMLGLADRMRVVALFEAAMRGDVAAAIANLQSQYNEGADPAQTLLEVAEFVHLTTRVKIAPDVPLSAIPPEEFKAAQNFSQKLSMPVLNRAWQILMKGINEARESARPLASADMVLVRLAYAADLPTPDEALRKLGFGQPGGGGSALAPPNGQGNGQGVRAQIGQASQANQAAQPPSGAMGLQPVARMAVSGSTGAAREQRQSAHAQVKPLEAPMVLAQFARLEDVIAKAAAERDIQLKLMLERDVRLVRFERGRIEFSLRPGGAPELAQLLMRRLQDWTGERWIVAISTREGQPSLDEQNAVKKQARLEGVAAHPFVRAVLDQFPGAQIVSKPTSIVDMEPIDAAESADDIIYADNAPMDDDDPLNDDPLDNDD